MSKTKPRILLSLLAVILCISIFPVTAFASGGDYHDYELPPPESTEAEKTEEAETEYTGTVTTNGGNLNVRTGAGMDNQAFTQLANGTVVEVIGTDGDWIKILLPERVGYVHGKYLTISSTEKKPTDTGETTTQEPTEPSTVQGEPFSEESDISTRDLLYDKETNKQFITVQDRDGNTFYIVIDYDSPVGEEEEQYKTYFLNPVDLADMEGLAEDGGETEAPTCVCANKCVAGSVNTGCEVCAVNMTECMGKEPEPEVPDEPTEPVEEPEEKGGMGGIIVFVLIAALGGGAAFYFLKVKKGKPQTKGSSNLDDYDYGEDEEYEFEQYDEESETEDETEDEDA